MSAAGGVTTNALPLFHLYGDPPDDQAFDFIHIETIASRSSIHDWTHHHVIYSQPSTWESAWRVQQEPR